MINAEKTSERLNKRLKDHIQALYHYKHQLADHQWGVGYALIGVHIWGIVHTFKTRCPREKVRFEDIENS